MAVSSLYTLFVETILRWVWITIIFPICTIRSGGFRKKRRIVVTTKSMIEFNKLVPINCIVSLYLCTFEKALVQKVNQDKSMMCDKTMYSLGNMSNLIVGRLGDCDLIRVPFGWIRAMMHGMSMWLNHKQMNIQATCHISL